MKRKQLDKELNIEKITERLESMGLSPSKLASTLGVSRQAVAIR
jgi:predicted transcriptional regulator